MKTLRVWTPTAKELAAFEKKALEIRKKLIVAMAISKLLKRA